MEFFLVIQEKIFSIAKSINTRIQMLYHRYMYLKKAWHLKTYIDTNSSIDFEKLH